MADDKERETRDLVIRLASDVQHLSRQIDQLLKLEDRLLACEKMAMSAKDFASRLLWAVSAATVTAVGAVIAHYVK